MNFAQRIESKLFKKSKSPHKFFHEVCFILAKEFGWSYEEIINSPTPFVLGMMQELEEHHKREKAAMKKGK